MNYTQIKRLFQNNTEFVPITLSEAVVVNTSTIPGLTDLGITTLDKVLRNTLGLIGANAQNIETLGGHIVTLTGVVQQINNELQNKQDKLTAGVGISITKNDQNQTVISVNHSLEIYKIITTETWNTIKDSPSQSYENVIYLVPQPSITSDKLCGGIFVAIPTAIPIVPFTNIFGNLEGKTTGSSKVSSKFFIISTVFLRISLRSSSDNLESLDSV